MPKDFSAFTTTSHQDLLRVLQSEIQVRLARSLSRGSEASWGFIGMAIWDTGATMSCISRQVASVLNLLPISRTTVVAAGNSYDSPIYRVDFLLPNKVVVQEVNVTEGLNLQGCDVLLGMDIITIGDFAITNAGGTTVFSFRFPPDISHINFVEEANRIRTKREHQQLARRRLKKRYR